MFRASSAHLQKDIVVYMQNMVPSLSVRVLVACRYEARVRTDCSGKVVGGCINLLKPNDIYIYIYMSYRSANLKTLHFNIFIQQIYILNILNMLHNLRLFLFKMPFIS